MNLKTHCALCEKTFGEHCGTDARCIAGIPGVTFIRRGYQHWNGAICKHCYRPIQLMHSGPAHFDMRVTAHKAEALDYSRFA